MRITRDIKVSVEEATVRIEKFLSNLLQQEFPGDISIINPRKNWDNNIMNFSFIAKKLFVRVEIKGNVEIKSDKIIFNTVIPPIVLKFVTEQKIRDVINSKLELLFPE